MSTKRRRFRLVRLVVLTVAVALGWEALVSWRWGGKLNAMSWALMAVGGIALGAVVGWLVADVEHRWDHRR